MLVLPHHPPVVPVMILAVDNISKVSSGTDRTLSALTMLMYKCVALAALTTGMAFAQITETMTVTQTGTMYAPSTTYPFTSTVTVTLTRTLRSSSSGARSLPTDCVCSMSS
ncbi:hypothetical protein AcW1_010192 [Taiwanofungus camphoratus]|nr:hypothetical protein AcW1_010192 [Antrodia cinnamomea]